jgi:DNA primase
MDIEQMQDTLDRLDVKYVGTRGSEIQGFCPGHLRRTGHEDRNPSWYINSETGAHICFSCGFKGSLTFLVCYLKGFYTDTDLDISKAKEWLGEVGELSDAFERALKPKVIFEEVTYITEATLAAFTLPPAYALKSRGLTREAAQHYGLLWDVRRELWIIPIRDPETGKLLGWQEKGYTGRYFNNYPAGVKKSRTLFGYDKYISGPMILVESPLDVVRLASVGILGGVAAYGSIVSKDQVSLLKDAGVLYLALDNDEAGQHSTVDILDASFEEGFECWMFNYTHTDMKDVGGMSKSEILAGLENAQHSLSYSPWWVS